MLQFLKINNFLLLKKQDISFCNSYIVITGETGSGKSMLIKALRYVLGEKIDNFDISESDTSVIAEFKIKEDNKILKDLLNENDIDIEDNVILLRRTLNTSNKTKCFINDIPVTTKLLKKVSDELVEFHSQHKQLEAFSKSNSLNIIDQFSGNDLILNKVFDIYTRISKLNKHIDELYEKKKEIEENKEYIEHSFNEIESLNLEEGDELDLIEKKKKFNNKLKIISAIDSLISLFSRDDGIIQKLIRAQRNINKLEYDLNLEDPIETAIFHFNELQDKAEEKIKDFDSYENIDLIEERLSKIKELSRKYRCTSDQLLSIAKDFQKKLDSLAIINKSIKDLTSEKERNLKDYFIQAEILSKRRNDAAKCLENKIKLELKQLKLEQVEFYIEMISDKSKPICIKGIDQARFLIKTNKGFAFAEIDKIASGGELSRIMLAFKVALAQINQKNTIIFDEIDSGTGGAVAQTIGNRMKKLAESNQIIAISHQPQVAAKASQHLLIRKSIGKTTETIINDLTKGEKTQEIARMLAGINITDSAVKAALSLMEE